MSISLRATMVSLNFKHSSTLTECTVFAGCLAAQCCRITIAWILRRPSTAVIWRDGECEEHCLMDAERWFSYLLLGTHLLCDSGIHIQVQMRAPKTGRVCRTALKRQCSTLFGRARIATARYGLGHMDALTCLQRRSLSCRWSTWYCIYNCSHI